MKHMTKRWMAWLLIAAICISLLSGLSVTAFGVQVDYVTGSITGYSNIIRNWGKRGTTATFLSPNAEDFYEKNNITYDALMALSGSSSVSAVPSSDLYEALQDLMADNHKKINSYDDTRNMYAFTDCEESSTTGISSFYSGTSIGPEWNGNVWNREHTWPKSKSTDGACENDIMMLRPTASSENSSRGNKGYGESSGYYDPNEVSNGAYNLHGDVARIMLYVYVRWDNPGPLFGAADVAVMESLDVLLDWMEEDPVDTWEMGRNDSVESITGTRNVFVDYPELAFQLFGEEVPAGMVTPSGEANQSDYTITAQTNDSTMGTVSVSGSVINAQPAEGYQVKDYTLVSGTATVKQEGNAFYVTASSDCTICINFEAKGAATVTYMENGTKAGTVQALVGDSIKLPALSGTAPENYTFVGWVTSTVAATTQMPGTIYAAGSNYTVQGNVTFYALYSRMDKSSTGSSAVFEKYTGAVTEGDYLIVSAGGAMNTTLSNSRLQFTKVTVSNNTIANPAASLIWHIAPNGNYWTLYNEAARKYAGGTGGKNKAALLSSVTDYAKWSITADGSNYKFENLGNKNKSVNHTLRRNADYGFACYAATTGTAPTLYKKVEGTMYYSTTAAECLHKNWEAKQQQDPNCTDVGYTAGKYCNDCQTWIEGHEEIGALKHDYDSVVTPATQNEQGYTTYTCKRTNCGHSYVGDYTDALKDIHKVTFVVPEGVSAIDGADCGTKGITLPAAGAAVGDHDYVFAGWAKVTVDNSTTAPTLYKAGSTFTTDADVTLYALYTYVPADSGTGEWTLVTDASKLTAGTQLVIASHDKNFVAGNITSQYMAEVGTTFSSDLKTIPTMPEGAVILTLGGSKDAWTLSNADGKLLGATAVKKVAWGNGTTTWTITINASGDATIQNTNSNYGRFLHNVQNTRFTTYTSDTNVSMLLPQLYMMDGTVYYTTVIINTCKHPQLEEVPADPANHEKDGTIKHYKCEDCGLLFADAEGKTELGANEIVDPKVPHTYGGEYEHDKTHHWQNCECGHEGEKFEHTYGDWVTVKKPGEGVEGSKERTCSVCGYKQTGTIPADTNPPSADNSMIGLWMVTMIVSAFGVVIVLRKKEYC